MITQRLTIRRFVADDLKDFVSLIQDKMNSEYAVYDEQFPTDEGSIQGILSYFADTDEFMAVELLSEKRVIGFVSLNSVDDTTRNLGYCIHSAYQKQGYTTETIKMIMEYARDELKVHRLVTGTANENLPSVHLLEEMGFEKIGESEGSFCNDEKGNPILFTGGSYEYIFKQ